MLFLINVSVGIIDRVDLLLVVSQSLGSSTSQSQERASWYPAIGNTQQTLHFPRRCMLVFRQEIVFTEKMIFISLPVLSYFNVFMNQNQPFMQNTKEALGINE